METSRAPFDAVTPFKYVGGDASVDFVNTVDWTGRGRELDQFSSYARILEWARGAGVLDRAALAPLRETASASPKEAERVLGDAIRLRGTLETLYSEIARGGRAASEIGELNDDWLRRSLPELSIVARRRGRVDGAFELGWPRVGNSLEAPLWIVTWAAARLITSPDVSRIRRCGGTDCGWYYVDRSRNGLRRWCQMETCGTRMKSRRRAERNELLR